MKPCGTRLVICGPNLVRVSVRVSASSGGAFGSLWSKA